MSDPNVPLRDSLSVVNDRAAIEQMEERVLAAMSGAGYAKASLFAVRLCLHEAVSNAFRHGHRGMGADVPVEVRYDVDGARVVLSVTDRGPGFDPGSVPDPTLEENLERGSGRGLLLIRAYMAEATYNEAGNSLRMTYSRPG